MMGKIIKFDPDRRRKPGKRSWTRPEDYGMPSRATPPRRRKRAPAPRPPAPAGQAGWQAKLAVAAIILAAILTSLYGLS